ncbi:fumarylacetoacetate hydrolase family protein [Ramlibacter sp.]|uniref:fumarylacetoacetate hydrolase family protein n=1 Tax=Ramlibacter sp. TaxID=1917967 RepID=UPI003D0DF78D
MRFVSIQQGVRRAVALADAEGALRGYWQGEPGYPGSLDAYVARGAGGLRDLAGLLAAGTRIDAAGATYLPVLSGEGRKIICVGLNYKDHAAESGYKSPDHPTLFVRFASSLVGHGAPIVRPSDSTQLDFEGELVAVIGKGGRRIPRERALDHVCAYSIFNDGSVRDVQHRTPQWTLGKNYDGTGAFGPQLVTADELPPGGAGLRIRTRLNGQVVQDASTSDLVFDVATLVRDISAAVTLEPGDILVTGTPSGVGAARKPPLWMKPGDVCEVEIEGLGILRNPIVDEASAAS